MATDDEEDEDDGDDDTDGDAYNYDGDDDDDDDAYTNDNADDDDTDDTDDFVLALDFTTRMSALLFYHVPRMLEPPTPRQRITIISSATTDCNTCATTESIIYPHQRIKDGVLYDDCGFPLPDPSGSPWWMVVG